MLISSKGRYGLKAMYLIAIKDSPLSVKQMAQTERLSEQYLEQLIATLKRDNLIFSKRGAKGGYILAKKPEEITVGDILRSLEGDFMSVDCISGECDYEDCSTKQIWHKIHSGINSVLDSYTLQDMIDGNKIIRNSESEIRN